MLGPLDSVLPHLAASERSSLVWLSEDSEDAGVPFLRAFLPGGSLLETPIPASQVHVKPLSPVASSCTVQSSKAWMLQAMKRPGKGRSSRSWRRGSPFPGGCALRRCHLTPAPTISPWWPRGATAEQGPEDAQ